MSVPFRIAPIDQQEVLRRAAMRNPSAEELRLVKECCRDAEYLIEYHITERNRPLSLVTDEALLARLGECDSVIIFTASLGEAFQELIGSHDEPEKDILYQGLAAERLDALIESYLDHKEASLKENGAALTPHFPYYWEGEAENAVTSTQICGVSLHPEKLPQSRCRSCFAAACRFRKEPPAADYVAEGKMKPDEPGHAEEYTEARPE